MTKDLYSDGAEVERLSWQDCSRETCPGAFDHLADKDDVARALASLKEARHERIVRLRYGLYGGPPVTLREVGREMHVSVERIRQLEKLALRTMRSHLSATRLRRKPQIPASARTGSEPGTNPPVDAPIARNPPASLPHLAREPQIHFPLWKGVILGMLHFLTLFFLIGLPWLTFLVFLLR